MVISSKKSTVMAPYKCGTKGLSAVDASLNESLEKTTNELFGYDLINFLETKNFEAFKHSTPSKVTLETLYLLLERNDRPFFVLIRDPYPLYRAQIIQSMRELCRKNTILNEAITLSNLRVEEKNSFFKLFLELYPTTYSDIFSNTHYTSQLMTEALAFIQYVQMRRPDIYNNLFILNLDNYSQTNTSNELLCDFHVFDKKYLEHSGFGHSTKSLFLSKWLEPDYIPVCYRIPFKENFKSIELIKQLFSDKFYSLEKLQKYGTPI